MIGWLIVLGILALLLGLLLSPLVFALDYDDPKDRFFWKLSWLGIPLLSSEGKGVFRKKTGKPEKKERRKEPETEEKPEHTDKKGKLKRYWKIAQNSLSVLPKPLRRLWKGLSLRHLIVGVQVGRFDAKECALAVWCGECSSIRCGRTAEQCHACPPGTADGAVCLRAGTQPLGDPWQAALLSAVRTSGAGQLCHGLCDAEKPAGRCRERTGGGKRTRCRPINRR